MVSDKETLDNLLNMDICDDWFNQNDQNAVSSSSCGLQVATYNNRSVSK